MVADLEPIPAQLGRLATEEEYYALGRDEPYELLDGRLVMAATASYRHEALFMFLANLISGYLGERGGGEVLGSRFAMRLDPRWSPEPDLLVLCDEHRDRLTERGLQGPADWVIEILSSSGMRIESRYKLPRYREAGVPEIWLVDPFTKTVRVDVREADGTYGSTTHDTGRIASRTFPGFWIDAAWLNRERLPAPLPCLRRILGEA